MSLSLDFSSMLTSVFNLINNLWPVFVIPIGFTIGIAMLAWIVDEIGKSVKRR